MSSEEELNLEEKLDHALHEYLNGTIEIRVRRDFADILASHWNEMKSNDSSGGEKILGALYKRAKEKEIVHWAILELFYGLVRKRVFEITVLPLDEDDNLEGKKFRIKETGIDGDGFYFRGKGYEFNFKIKALKKGGEKK